MHGQRPVLTSRVVTTVSALVTAVAAVILWTAPAQAAPVSVTIGDFTYAYDDATAGGDATITAYGGSGGTVILPSTVDIAGTPHSVTAIGSSVFSNKNLTEVTIPESVVSIGTQAFIYNELTHVTIPDSVTSLGQFAFFDNLLTTVSIGSGITGIPESAFSNNDLASVAIPASVTAIASYAFYGNKITSVAFPAGVKTIGYASFFDNALTSLLIPASVTSISSFAFGQNPGLTSVRFLGPAPTTSDAGTAGESFETSSGSLVLSYPQAFGAPATPGGYTTPLWKGYATAPAVIAGLAPTITGTVREGKTLTAHKGQVTPVAATFTYRWKANGRTITGATGRTFKLGKAQAGRRMSVRVKATAPGVPSRTVTSRQTTRVSSAKKRIIVSDYTVKAGQRFTVTATGFRPGQAIAVWLGGTQRFTGTANSVGVIHRTVKFSSSIRPGTRRVRVSGYDSKGKRTGTVLTRVTYRR